MSLMAVFNCSFLITLILFLLVIGLIWIHFNQKINDQNIKMNQMVHLLTTMTQEVSLLRKKVGLSFNDEIIDISEENIKEEKIDVSDDDSDNDSDDSDSNSDDSDDSDSNSDEDEEVDNKVDVSQDTKSSSIELIEIEELSKLEDQLEESEKQLNELEEKLNKLEELPSKELVEVKLEEEPEEEESHDDVLEEKQEDQPDKEEYKKMSLNKLKALVLEKKLTSDVSKLKKNDLLTILGIEV